MHRVLLRASAVKLTKYCAVNAAKNRRGSQMRTYIGTTVAMMAALTFPAAAARDQVDAKDSTALLQLVRQDCATTGKKSKLCELVDQIDAKAPAALPKHGPARTKVGGAQPTAPSKIPPLMNVPLNPPWLPPRNPPWCVSNTQGLFVRADPLDNFHYLVDPAQPSSSDSSSSSAGSATGASVSYTDNRAAGTQTATIKGRVSYLVVGQTPCDAPNTREPFIYGFALAPFISSNGTWDEPLKKTSNSALQTGADFQLAISTAWPVLDFSYLYASPYHQTDLRDLANVNGILFAWEPVLYKVFMDAAPKTNNPYFSFFWQLRAEAEILNVEKPGLTNLAKGDHAWLGETVRANIGLFPENTVIPWPEPIAGRISLIGTAQNFYDAEATKTAKTANYYTLELQYKLGPCKTPAATTSGNSTACAIQGSSAISFEYDQGTNKDTLVFANEYLVKFSYAY
jgi:hypothetical protein